MEGDGGRGRRRRKDGDLTHAETHSGKSSIPSASSSSSSSASFAEEEVVATREEILAQLRETRHLDLSKRELTNESLPPELPYMSNLEMLSMAQNELSVLPKSFAKLSKLVALNLNSNAFSEMPQILGKLPALSILDLRNNRITELHPSTLKKMTALTKLLLRNNRVVFLPPELGHLKSLQLLSVRNNHLISVPSELNQLDKLQVFDARGNQLKSIPSLGGLRSLLELDLQHNNIDSLPTELSSLSSLTRLSLGFNNFSEFPSPVLRMVSLTELDLESNKLSVIPREIDQMTSLRILYLSRNKIDAIPNEINGLSQLEKLSLANNELRILPVSSLADLKKLTELDLEDNPLDLDKDIHKSAEVAKHLSFVANLKLPQPPEVLASRKGVTSIDSSASRSLFLEGGIMSMFNGESGDGQRSDGARDIVRKGKTKDSSRELHEKLIRDYFALDDVNKPGLQKAKKEPIQQEDAHCCHFPFFEQNDVGLFCVLDGHAGQEAALNAAQLLPKELNSQLKIYKKENKKIPQPFDMSVLLHMAFIKTDEQMKQYQYEGCTATAVVVWQNRDARYLQCANVGDSSAYLYRSGEPICLTHEHKLTNESERGRIVSSGVWLTEGQTRIAGIGVTRVLGDHFAKDTGSGMLGAPDSSPVYHLTPEDTHFVLASDGLWDVMTASSAGDVVAKEETAEAAARVLMKRALASAKCKDNVTIIVVCL